LPTHSANILSPSFRAPGGVAHQPVDECFAVPEVLNDDHACLAIAAVEADGIVTAVRQRSEQPRPGPVFEEAPGAVRLIRGIRIVRPLGIPPRLLDDNAGRRWAAIHRRSGGDVEPEYAIAAKLITVSQDHRPAPRLTQDALDPMDDLAGRLPARARLEHRRAVLLEQTNSRAHADPDRKPQRSVAIVIRSARVSAASEQQPNARRDLLSRPSTLDRMVERGVAIAVGPVRISPMLQQELDDLLLPLLDRRPQRRLAALVSCIHQRRLFPQQRVHAIPVAFPDSIRKLPQLSPRRHLAI
jgi:hypothetical protein